MRDWCVCGLDMVFGVGVGLIEFGTFPGWRKGVNRKEDMDEVIRRRGLTSQTLVKHPKFLAHKAFVPPSMTTFTVIASPNTQPRLVVI